MDMTLQLLLGVLKKGLARGPHAAADSQALLGPLLPLLTQALQSRHAPCTSLALRCLASVSAPPLPGQTRLLSPSHHHNVPGHLSLPPPPPPPPAPGMLRRVEYIAFALFHVTMDHLQHIVDRFCDSQRECHSHH